MKLSPFHEIELPGADNTELNPDPIEASEKFDIYVRYVYGLTYRIFFNHVKTATLEL